MVSSSGVTVPHVLSAATVIALGATPGVVMLASTSWPAAFLPLLPADTETTRPAATACSTLMHNGSVMQGSTCVWPSDMLTTLMPYLPRLAMVHCTPAMTSLV